MGPPAGTNHRPAIEGSTKSEFPEKRNKLTMVIKFSVSQTSHKDAHPLQNKRALLPSQLHSASCTNTE